MQQASFQHEKTAAGSRQPADMLLAQKRQIRALKRVLIAKAEVRRLKSLLGRRRVSAG